MTKDLDSFIMKIDEETSKVVNELSNQLTTILDTVYKVKQDASQDRAEMNVSIGQLSEALMILNSRLVRIEEYLKLNEPIPASSNNSDMN